VGRSDKLPRKVPQSSSLKCWPSFNRSPDDDSQPFERCVASCGQAIRQRCRWVAKVAWPHDDQHDDLPSTFASWDHRTTNDSRASRLRLSKPSSPTPRCARVRGAAACGRRRTQRRRGCGATEAAPADRQRARLPVRSELGGRDRIVGSLGDGVDPARVLLQTRDHE
jgi:hypothetical protein